MKETPSSVNRVLQNSGRPLETPLRRDMENRFGHDFSHVRVHTGKAADQSARDVNARAYTTGRNVVFADGEYSPTGVSGRRLIAHELAHVLQQAGSNDRPSFLQRSAKVAGCGLLNLAGSITGIGSMAHIQIQLYLAAKGITPEFWIPRATKLQPGLGCRKLGTEPGFADLAKKSPLGYDLAEIKPVTMGGRLRAKLEAAHYRRRAAQSMQRLFKMGGACAKRPAGVDDIAFGGQIGATPATVFSQISGALTGDETIGPFGGDPSLTLKAKEISPGAVCYWCTKSDSKKPEPPKPKGPNVGFGISIGGSSSGAYNAGVGISIMSESTAYGTAGAGISYKSDTKAAGAVGAGASIESDSIAAGAAGAGASKDTQSIGAGVAGAGASEGSVSAAAGAAGAGTSKDSATAGAGVAGKGSVKDSAVAGAGSSGSGKIENVQGTGTGSPGKPVDAKDTEGGGKSETPKSETAEGKPGDKPAGADQKAGEGISSKGDKTGAGAGTTGGEKTGDGPAKDAQTDEDKSTSGGSGAASGAESAAAKGAQGAKEAGPDAGTGADTSGGQKEGTKTNQEGRGSVGSAAKVGGLGVAPVVGFPATDADRKKAAEEAAKVALLLSKASPAQIALFRYVAQSSPNGQYVVPASQWVDTMMKAVEGLSEDDIKYLRSLNWTPGHLSAEELRKKILELLKEKKPAATGAASKEGAPDVDTKGATKGQGGGVGKSGGKDGGSGDGAKGSKKGSNLSAYRKGRKYTGDIGAYDDAGFQIQPDDKQITMKTRVGTKVTLEIRWLTQGDMDRALAEYEVVAGPTVDHDPNSQKQFWRFDLKSTNTEPLVLSPEGAPKATVLPAHAPASYYMLKKK
jgi:hypothetical protein